MKVQRLGSKYVRLPSIAANPLRAERGALLPRERREVFRRLALQEHQQRQRSGRAVWRAQHEPVAIRHLVHDRAGHGQRPGVWLSAARQPDQRPGQSPTRAPARCGKSRFLIAVAPGCSASSSPSRFKVRGLEARTGAADVSRGLEPLRLIGLQARRRACQLAPARRVVAAEILVELAQARVSADHLLDRSLGFLAVETLGRSGVCEPQQQHRSGDRVASWRDLVPGGGSQQNTTRSRPWRLRPCAAFSMLTVPFLNLRSSTKD